MLDLNYHYKIINESNVIFQFPHGNKFPGCHFGDKIAILNMHVHHNNLLMLNGKLNASDLSDDDLYLAKLFFNNITELPPTYLINLKMSVEHDFKMLSEIYKNYYKNIYIDYTATNNKKYVSYSYDGYSFLTEKVPCFFIDGITELNKKYTNYEFVEIGKKIGLEKTIKLINESACVITIDNGIAHLCRCMNTRYIIISKSGWDITRGFPKEYCTYESCDSYDDMINIQL